MSRSLFFALVLVLAAVLYSCSGEDGAVGPRGPMGNANVKTFLYGSETTTTGYINYTFLASQGFVDSCMVLGYYNPSSEAASAWYPVPGLGSTGLYMTRSMWYQSNPSPSTYMYRVFLETPSGSGNYLSSVTFTKFKIILVPSNSITSVTSKGLLDLSDYHAVVKYLGLEE